MQLEQFFNIIGTKISKNTIVKKSSRQTLFTADDMSDKVSYKKNVIFHVLRLHTSQFERDDDKRAFRIQEFIKTERSYVETLQTLVKYVVHPLKSIMQQKHCILNTYKCTKIFLNIDQIASANQQFLDDLEHNHESFGDICREHVSSIKNKKTPSFVDLLSYRCNTLSAIANTCWNKEKPKIYTQRK